MKMTINIIVAMTKDRVIGKDGTVPWKISEDMKLFKELTTNKVVIMGKNTWNSLPEKFRPLPERTNIIVSNTLPGQKGAIVCRTVHQAIETARGYNGDIYCIGGAQLYGAMLPIADVLHISWIIKPYKGDTYFPEINFKEWKEEEKKEFKEFIYSRYIRKDT